MLFTIELLTDRDTDSSQDGIVIYMKTFIKVDSSINDFGEQND